jgi:hypothetical protein
MNGPVLEVLMITHNRPAYTRLSLERLLESCTPQMQVWVWHNGDDSETIEVVKGFGGHRHLHRLEISPQNKRLREPTNWFWSNAKAPYLAKVDDDCLVPDGWGEALVKAHEDNPSFGALACWHFPEEDFVHEVARKKIKTFAGGHQVMVNCWVQGSGYVMKRACVEKHGLLRDQQSFTHYCIQLAAAGWQNGWYYPLILEDHMDDPRSQFFNVHHNGDFVAHRPLSAINHGVKDVNEWIMRLRWSARHIQEAAPDPRCYTGWREKWSHAKVHLRRFFRLPAPWERMSSAMRRQASANRASL